MIAKALQWIGDVDGCLELLDQRLLPGESVKLECRDTEQLYEAIKTLAVRGAPAIGVSAAYGVCLSLRSFAGTVSEAFEVVQAACDDLAASRPTAVNLFWALERMKNTAGKFIADNPGCSADVFKQILLDEAHAICTEDKAMCDAIGRNGMDLIPDGGAVLTHCNAGALATAGIGTALAPMYLAHENGKRFRVYVDETRPLLQGARLTAWELTQAGNNLLFGQVRDYSNY